jgi:DNA-binding CsgD family transcriptional regulator
MSSFSALRSPDATAVARRPEPLASGAWCSEPVGLQSNLPPELSEATQPAAAPPQVRWAQPANLLHECDGATIECLLQQLPQAVILVDSKGTVGGLNERATAIVTQADGLIIHHGVLRCRHPDDTGALHRLLVDADRRIASCAAESGRGLRIRRPVGRRPLTALINALRDKNTLRNAGAVIAVLVNDPEHAPAFDTQMLRDWYDLTPAEARVAMLLASGLSVDEIVERLGIGANTARTHLKNIFAKTDTRRQGDLIRLLLSNPALGPAPVARWGVELTGRMESGG